MLGYTRDELLKMKIGDLSENKPPYTGQKLFMPEMQKARSGMPQTFDWRSKTKDGRLLWVELSIRRATFGGREFPAFDRPRNFTTQGSRRPAQEDGAVRPPYRFGQSRRIRRRGSPGHRARRAAANAASRCFISISIISRMSTIRWDTLSETGCCKSVAERLQANVRTADTAGPIWRRRIRLADGDISDPTDAGVLADKLLQIMAEPFLLDGNQIHSGVSIGIATYEPDDAGCRNASRACGRRALSGEIGRPPYLSVLHRSDGRRKCANAWP